MIRPSFFIEKLKEYKIDFFSGVPDSLLKNICAYITDTTDKDKNIIAANEGAAIGLASGYHLATNEIPMVYMQNSGLGNIINPLLSLIDKDVYNIPVLLVIGWRGEPNIKDEPQHIKQGRVTIPLLETMGVEYYILSEEEDIASLQIKEAVAYMKKTNEPLALIVKKGTFDKYTLKSKPLHTLTLKREDSIREFVKILPSDSVVVSTTGKISRELFEVRTSLEDNEHNKDFLTVGSMGHANQIALGIALQQPNRKVFCFDGDGAILMHTGSMSIIGNLCPKNYIHVIFNNGAHESVGGQPTVALDVDLLKIAEAFHYKHTFSVENKEELDHVLSSILSLDGPIFVEVKVALGSRSDLGRPTTTPIQNKKALMKFLQIKE